MLIAVHSHTAKLQLGVEISHMLGAI